MRRRLLLTVLAALPVAGCASLAPKPRPAAPVQVNQDPYPSTYQRYAGAPTVIRGATVFDGDGKRIDNGTVVFADGLIQAVGGPEVASPPGAVEIGTGSPPERWRARIGVRSSAAVSGATRHPRSAATGSKRPLASDRKPCADARRYRVRSAPRSSTGR